MGFTVLLWTLLLSALAENVSSVDWASSSNSSFTAAESRWIYKELLKALFNDYNPNIPANAGNLSQPVDLSLGLIIDSLSDLDIQTQRLSLLLWVDVSWEDPGLRWDTAEYPVPYIVVGETQIWRPVLFFDNSVLNRDQLMKIQLPVMLSADGYVNWYPSDNVVLDCPVDLRHYPFDQQTCAITITQYVGDDSVNVTDNIYHSAKTTGNGEWDIVGIRAERKTVLVQGFPFWKVTFELTLRRKWLFYALNVLFPMALVSALISVVFLLPVNSGDKMSVSVTNFLTLAVFMTLMQDSLPQNSDTVCYLAVYLASQLVLGALAVVLSAVTVGWCHGHTHPARVGAAEPGAGMEAQQKTMDGHKVQDGWPHPHPTMEARAHRMDVICFRLFIIISVLSFIIYCLSISI